MYCVPRSDLGLRRTKRYFLPACEALERRLVAAASISDPGSQTSSEHSTVQLDIEADPDGGSIEWFFALNLPDGLSQERIGLNTLRISGEVSYDIASQSNPFVTSTVTVWITGHMMDNTSIQFDWAVTNVNRPPVITYSGDWTMLYEGQEVNMQLAAEDPDGDQLTYQLSGLPSGLSCSDDGLVTGTAPTHTETDAVKEYNLSLIVDDGIDTDTDSILASLSSVRITSVTINVPAGFTGLDYAPTAFTVTVTGIGASPSGNDLRWSVIDEDPLLNDELQAERTFTVTGSGATGAFTTTLTFYLHKNTAREVAGADGTSGEDPADVFVRIENWWGVNLGDSAVVSIGCLP